MKFLAACTIVFATLVAAPAIAQSQCSASVLSAPDGTSLSILFDDLVVPANGQIRKSCTVAAPLNLPAGYSLGVYRVDYRGFAHLSTKETAALVVDYALGPKSNGRQFKRTVRGATDEDFLFTENIGAGQMKRAGCGASAVLNVSVELALSGGPDALAAMDSSDGTSKHGIIYMLDLKKC